MDMFDRVRRLLDVTLGEGVLADADPEDLFDISTGYVTLGSNGYPPRNRAGLCFGTVDAADFSAVTTDIAELLDVSSAETVKQEYLIEDEFGYTWVLVENTDFETVVTDVYSAADTLINAGFGSYLLAAVFAFDGQQKRAPTAYLIYNFKRGTWYPFVPVETGSRDTRQESELRELLDGELDIESEQAREYAFWDIPV